MRCKAGWHDLYNLRIIYLRINAPGKGPSQVLYFLKSYVQYLALITTVDYDRFMEVNDINSIFNYYTIFSTKHRRGEQFECAI